MSLKSDHVTAARYSSRSSSCFRALEGTNVYGLAASTSPSCRQSLMEGSWTYPKVPMAELTACLSGSARHS